jgi:class 3 adenylate cyclase
MAGKEVTIQKRIELAMPVADFWQAISNTDRLNRITGLPATHFTPVSTDGVVSHLGSKARFLGLPVEWNEQPFEWSEQQYFWVERGFKGLAALLTRRVITGARMKAVAPDKCTAELFADFTIRNPLGRAAVSLIAGKLFVNRMVTACRRFELNYQQRMPMLPPDHPPPHVNSRRLHTLTSALRRYPVQAGMVDRLVSHLTSAPDDAVIEMRPFALADEWGCARLEMLRLFLYATRAGLLDLSWEVLCPNCRVAKASYDSLSQLKPEAHCDTCNIRYDVNFDEYVELRFAVSPQVRNATATTYCIGGPFMTRHIITQVRLAAGERKQVTQNLANGNYRLRLRQLPGYIRLQARPDCADLQVDITLGGESRGSETISIAAGESSINLISASHRELLVMIEQESWDNQGVSAALATSLHEFRASFSSEVLAPGMSVAVRNLTFLFSDLKDSTSLYQRNGDSPAYARVRDHFGLITAAVAAHDGSMVKTMDDAVMAVFSYPEQAVAAAIAIQQAVATINQQADVDHLRVKLGLHSGPCLAVTANDILDYFGSTVNIAARVQSTSEGGDVVLTDALFNHTEVRDLLDKRLVKSFAAQLKGINEQVIMYRVRLDSD